MALVDSRFYPEGEELGPDGGTIIQEVFRARGLDELYGKLLLDDGTDWVGQSAQHRPDSGLIALGILNGDEGEIKAQIPSGLRIAEVCAAVESLLMLILTHCHRKMPE